MPFPSFTYTPFRRFQASLGQPDWRIAAVLLALTLSLVHWQIGSRFLMSIDEGIYLDGALHVSQGQVPYRDFFVLTGPWTFWWYGAVFRIFGATFANARWVLSFEIALQCMAIYWLLASLTKGWFAAATALLFAAFCLDAPLQLYVTHRWDSNTWALLSCALACSGVSQAKQGYLAAAGACAAIAALSTPPFLVVGILIAAWIALTAGARNMWAYGVGAAVSSIAAASWLAYQGALIPMVRHLLWTAGHYSAANRVSYGSLLIDPASYFEGAQGLDLAVRLARLTQSLIPSILPVAAYLGLAVVFWRRRSILRQDRAPLTLLLLFSAGLLVASLPRLAAHQLFFIMPVFAILCSYALYVLANEKWRSDVTAACTVAACLFLASSVHHDMRATQKVVTHAGELRCTPADGLVLSALVSRIHPHDGLFVFPYIPIVYFVTGGQNPTRYSFLQPGLMTDEAGSDALAELQSHPPRWIFWWQAPTSFWILTWPNIDPTRRPFPLIESFIESQYRDSLRLGPFVLKCQAGSCENGAVGQ